jgi:hypothetical protein
MQANHHHTSATRVTVYYGRSHTKKQLHNSNPPQPFRKMKSHLKKIFSSATNNKGNIFGGSKASPFWGGWEGAKRVGQKPSSKIIYTHYNHSEKPPHICRKGKCNKKQKYDSATNKKVKKLAVS